MSKFLAEIGNVTNVKPYSTNILDVFDRLAQQRQIWSNRNTGALAWGAGSVGTGSGSIIFDFGNISKFVSLFILELISLKSAISNRVEMRQNRSG